jgi:hypothetical protein
MYPYHHQETNGKNIRKVEGTLKQKPNRAEKQQKFRTFWFSHLIFSPMISRPIPQTSIFYIFYMQILLLFILTLTSLNAQN